MSPKARLAWRSTAAAACVTIVLLVTGCRAKGGEIGIGVIAMLEGENRENGREMTNAAALAAREVNDRGGLLVGRERLRVILVVENDPNTPEGALGAARTLLSQDRVVALVGPQFSGNAIPVARLAESSRVVMIAPMSTNPETTAGKSYVFRVPFLDTFQGSVIARFARKDLDARRAAVLYDVAEEYNRTLAEEFRRVFVERGGAVVAFETYTTDRNTDFSVQVGRIARAHPDVLFLPNYAEDARRQARQAREGGVTAVLLGGDGWDPAFAEEKLFDGSYTVRQWHASLPSEKARSFVIAFTTAYKKAPEDVAATTYDALSLLFAAIEGAGSADPVAVQQRLHTMGRFEGVTGSLDYARGGDPDKNVIVALFKDGKASVYAVVEP